MMILIGVLAALSASAAAGMRIALPLLLIGLLRGDLWDNVPILALVHPQVVVGVLTSWSLFELLGSKKLLGQRVNQLVQLWFSPVVGAVMAIAALQLTPIEIQPLWPIAIVGGLLAFVLKLVQVGWFFRLRGLPLWVILLEDALCVFLVFFAFNAPQQGGLIAMLLLWLSVRSSGEWYRWYKNKGNDPERSPPSS
ncbi:DUF4126 domain-containing protein [Spirulina major CS-329]|uniref:DUF4126 domain-containing protein n=1 Tax=Spirulina TaxID=1154 RepID=UPI00232BBC18|nr:MULTISPECIES: DUF4126 domain-containing protein [Spirulina]MDB9496813.1 DUF4126 domain-containing protein [Spirulina subsalsa CS-330]MDB9502894.1 DUF4126 domain-containing protein [Spirulina major CS-329]